MHVDEALKNRISIRAFLEQPVERAVLEELLDIARWSPSGGNLQPWKVIVVTGEAQKAVTEVAQAALWANPTGEADEAPTYPKPLGEPYRTRRYKIGEDMYALLGITREDKASRLKWVARNFEFFGAPVGLFFILDRSMGRGQWAHMGMFMQSLALAATARGMGTCMQESWGWVRKTLHSHLELKEEEVLYCGMALGFPDPEAAVNTLRSDRAEVAEFTKFAGFE